MLPFRVVLKPQHRLDLPAVPPWPSPISFTLIQPLSFQTFTHSFAQRATPIFFSFNRFRTLFSATEGIPPFLPLWNSSLCLSPCPPAPLCPLFSITYELQISQVLSFDIHACNGGVYPLPLSRMRYLPSGLGIRPSHCRASSLVQQFAKARDFFTIRGNNSAPPVSKDRERTSGTVRRGSRSYPDSVGVASRAWVHRSRKGWLNSRVTRVTHPCRMVS